jgi:hypothetical protein
MLFDVVYMRDGAARARFTVPAQEAGLFGVYRDGVPYRPDGAAIHRAMPGRYAADFERAALWLGKAGDGSDVFRADLWDASGRKPLGSVFARAVD